MSVKMKQIQMSRYGSPDVLTLIETDIPQPKAGELLIKVKAIGVNYADTLRRRNRYFMPTPLPFIPGTEAVGEIVAAGEGVEAPYLPGATVLAILPYGGAYSEYVAALAVYCVPLPPGMDAYTATAIFVQGSTAQLMISRLTPDLAGKTVLINAAAGGVGSLLVQLARQRGAKIIAACSSDEKLAQARARGAHAGVNYTLPGWGEAVRQANDGKGVDIAFEMVGGDVYNETLRSLAPGGHLVIYGCASGVQGSVHPEYFVDENLRQSGFNLAFFINNYMAEWQEALGAVIGMIAQGQLKIDTPKTFPLAEAAEAHRQIEARQTTGKVVLVSP